MGVIAPALPFIAAATGLIGAGTAAYGAYQSSQVKSPDIGAPPTPPDIPTPGDEAAKKRRKIGRQQTLLTQGDLSTSQTFRPTLLGQ